ncbi:hypothetical protein MMC30_000884 [Trapelia coarctata]|nr:hypothetical protein [Trapelia coarctata]
MNSSATLATTDNYTTQYGQPTDRHNSGELDTLSRNAGGLERIPESDVMDISMTTAQSTSDAHLAPGTSSSEAPALPSPLTSSSLLPYANSADTFTPLRICQKEHALQRPHPSQDLLSLYGLHELVASVARVDPITGEKINKMRRSYEGQVKAFQIAGRNKAVKVDEGTPGGLMDLVRWPDEEWQIQKVAGKPLEKGFSGATLAKLEKAMKLEPGLVPKNDEWENILGLEKLKGPIPTVETKARPVLPTTSKMAKTNGYISGMTVQTQATAGEVARPKRTGRKRRYDEHSFEGYGEGFVDDEGDIIDAGGYSSGECSRKSSVSKKKRKKA